MDKIKHIVPLCDETLDTIQVTSYLFEKYWPDHEIDFLGFKAPSFELPKNHHFFSLAPEQIGGAKKWTRYIESYVKNIDDEFLIFSLDDFFIGWQPDIEMLNEIEAIMKNDSSIGRFCLSYDAANNCKYQKIKSLDGYSVVEVNKGELYRISAQPALWRREYLLKFLSHDWSPWNFEVDGSRLSDTFSEKIYATSDPNFLKVPTRWVNKGAVSRHCPGKVNVLGLSHNAIIDLLFRGFYKEVQLQWGMWGGSQPIPQFYDLGGFSFHPVYMPVHDASPTNWREFFYIYDNPDPVYANEKKPMIVNLVDGNFIHTLQHPECGFFVSNAEPIERTHKILYNPFLKNFLEYSGITVFTDQFLKKDVIQAVNCRKKIGWIMEPKEIHGWAYDSVPGIIEDLDCIFTFSKELVEKYDKCHMLPFVHTTIKKEDRGVHQKSKLVSMIASAKFDTESHRLRHEIVKNLSEKRNIDVWGRGYKPFPSNGKIFCLKDYMFSIDVENSVMDTYFGHAIDIFMTGTIPIFRGGRTISEHFDANGVIFFDTIEELDEILKNLTFEDYYSRLDSVKKNYQIALQKYWNSDEQLYEAICKVFPEFA